ncbi:MAG: response regulator [Kofleriaceae bacterium]
MSRVAMNLPVELMTAGKKIRAVSQDVSAQGMFIRLSPPLPVRTEVQVAIVPEGERVIATGQIIHSLTEAEARTLGRYPGVGVMFREPERPSDQQFNDAVSRMLDHHTANLPPGNIRILVADPQTRLLERLSTALGSAGFTVATATNGMEAIGACLSRTPDVVLVERDMPVVDGLHVLQEMGRHTELAGVPVMMMSTDATDLIRLQSFQLGAMDFIPKPFTVLEVILRARRWARTRRQDAERVVLRGALSDLPLPALLTMFEQERKTGQLTVTREELVAWLDFRDGRLVRARSNEIVGDSREVLMSVLDWRGGFFELAAGTKIAEAELDSSITHLLLEHAQRADEATRQEL